MKRGLNNKYMLILKENIKLAFSKMKYDAFSTFNFKIDYTYSWLEYTNLELQHSNFGSKSEKF